MTDAPDTAAPTERYLVTMSSAFMLANGEIAVHKATDHVATADLDAYVADRKQTWQSVVVADQPDQITGDYTPPDTSDSGS